MLASLLRQEALSLFAACQALNDTYRLDEPNLPQFDEDFTILYRAAQAARQGMVTDDVHLLMDNVSKLHSNACRALQYLACYAYNRVS